MKIDKKVLKDYLANDNLDKYDNDDLIAMMYVSEGDLQAIADYVDCPIGKLWNHISTDATLLEEFGKVIEFAKFQMFEQSCETLKTVMDYASAPVQKEFAPNPAVNGAKFVFQNTSALWGINMKMKKGEGQGESEIEIVGDMYKQGVKELEADEQQEENSDDEQD